MNWGELNWELILKAVGTIAAVVSATIAVKNYKQQKEGKEDLKNIKKRKRHTGSEELSKEEFMKMVSQALRRIFALEYFRELAWPATMVVLGIILLIYSNDMLDAGLAIMFILGGGYMFLYILITWWSIGR